MPSTIDMVDAKYTTKEIVSKNVKLLETSSVSSCSRMAAQLSIFTYFFIVLLLHGALGATSCNIGYTFASHLHPEVSTVSTYSNHYGKHA